jgi:hypothetical protein
MCLLERDRRHPRLGLHCASEMLSAAVSAQR